ncbi:MAG TPA: CopK family periplasmic copper-binding protein [Rhodocyclaceae bacterium]|nr:CopK family periplasmic copper-binding protein [Rhodocyclaceae bacterium]
MFKKLAVVATASTIAFSAHAVTSSDVQEVVEPKDGGTVYIFNDGKTGMANRYGRPVPIPEGRALETFDGRTVEAAGNEVAGVTAVILEVSAPGS